MLTEEKQLFFSQFYCKMSLLTSPQTTREQRKFLGKMQREFNRRSFYNSNYVQPTSLLQQVNDNTDRAEEQIREAMKQFLGRLSAIIAESHNSRIDYYFVLNEMKSTDFFSEVAGVIAQDITNRSVKLEKENVKLREEAKKNLQRIRELERGQTTPPPPSTDLRFNGIKSIAQNLYQKAKLLNAQQFSTLCDRTLLGEKVVIKRVSGGEKGEDDVLKRIAVALESARGQEEQINALIAELTGQVQQRRKCSQPCCQVVTQSCNLRESKALQLRKSCDARRPQDVYKNDKSQEYFNRYYRRSEFDMRKVTNVEKTKLQEMEKIEDDYRINLKNFTLFSR